MKNICLFDLDGTLCDFHGQLTRDLNSIRGPKEDKIMRVHYDGAPKYLLRRMNLIANPIEWWARLPMLKAGLQLWRLAGRLGYYRSILTKGPKCNINGWTGKVIWVRENLGEDIDITITRDKGLVYGRILVDDWPEYIERWLQHRPRGLVIMPAHDYNESFKHPQVIRYTGRNVRAVTNAMLMQLGEKE